MPQMPGDSSPRDRTREDVFRLIQSAGQATRARIIELSGLSRSTVNHAVSRLLADERVTETQAEGGGPGSGSGRPAAILRVVPRDAPVAAIDFGHNHINVALGDPLGRPIAEERVEIDVDLRATDAMDHAAGLLDGLRASAGIDSVAAVVAGVPGPLDTDSGLVRSPTILSSWVGLDPRKELQRRLGVPVHAENDALLGAYGELHLGAGSRYSDFLYVKVSHGIGAGLVVGGLPYRGSRGFAGEIGHTPLPGHTEMCRCGNRGCLETVVSVSAIAAQIAHTRPGESGLRFPLQENDPVTDRILDDAGRTLGRVLAAFCNLLNPQALIVGGELGASTGALVQGITTTVTRHAQPAIAAGLDILPAGLGAQAELLGALRLATTLATN
ncbi:ROK family transcriptional regulator [Streptomyces poriferorum]|uniref:ROK family transcriptional regulator n=1 Tax=Streptomyces poriferorum TaxID=2798799 RepID=A0ABY9ILU5_9ACTN|nr:MULTISPECIES: ROK family transcriptional regulator [unclassified Streptomyces]MDP5316946.1 ROK family transcriptional regulator [Streptomyces sp. Alt4]WLQ55227.1 ROK family transcriptional regulator [Streptomyces sp. Alt2]